MMFSGLMMMQSSAEPEWTPTDIAGCVLWLRADMGITLESGRVSQWADQSGQDNHFTQSTAGYRPVVESDFVNGHDAIDFTDTSSEHLIGPSIFTSASWYTLFVVVNVKALDTSNQGVFGMGGGSDGYLHIVARSTLTHYLRVRYTSDGTNNAVTQTPLADFTAEAWHIMTVNAGASAGVFRLDGAQQDSDSITQPDFVTTTPTAYVATFIGATNGTMGGYIPEVILYNSALSGENVGTVESYLSTRYNISIT